MKSRVTLLNMVSGLVLQFFITISGFILPRLILDNFGSDANGLISSLTQFLSYITLVEGGITGVITASLYKPLVEGNNSQISSVVLASRRFFSKIGLLFALYTVGVAVVYPLVFQTGFSFTYVFTLTLILSMTLEIQYMFSLTLKTLLQADKKMYISSLSSTVVVILTILLVYLSVYIYPSVHVMKFISGILYLLPPIVFSRYVKKHYAIDWNAKPDDNLIANRWNGFAINFAFFIHSSTDISVLTIFTDLLQVSVYSVHYLVSNGLKQIVSAGLTGIAATVGQAYAKGD
ncbi:MAG: hypothetical protein KBS81_01070, partial [Spirochaetales bacterium]|nr:hypothetical protein [Candidatus Physcosoma equi]